VSEAAPNAVTLRIRSAADLLAALADPDPGVRMAVLKMVASQPARALAYGRHDGMDVIDALLAQAAGRERRGSWEVAVATLTVFRDPRVVEFFTGLLARARRADTLFTAADRLAHEPIAALRDGLLPLLMQNESDARARAAARLLLWASDLELAPRLRTALLAGRGRVAPPPLTDATATAWLAELDGLFGPLARHALETQGEPAHRLLCAHWDRLSETNRIWLLGWGEADAGGPSSGTREPPVLERALGSGSAKLALAALRRLPALGARAATIAPAIAALARSPDAEVRLAAIRAGASGLDFRALLASETSPELRRACLTSLARADGAAALPDLLAALRDPHWSVRAAATDALQALGETIVPAVEPLARDADARVRTAAVQVLIRLGREDWLEEELLA